MSADKRALEAFPWVPVFPLPNMVLFPHAILPLHIFEPRYRAMVNDCFPKPAKIVLARLLEPESSDEGAALPDISPIATVAEVLECEEFSDGRKNIVVRGEARVRLEELPLTAPYRRARLKVLADVGRMSESMRSALVTSAAAFAKAIQRVEPRFMLRLPSDLAGDALVDICAYQLIVDPDVRQELLEETHVHARAERVIAEMARQQAALQDQRAGRTLH